MASCATAGVVADVSYMYRINNIDLYGLFLMGLKSSIGISTDVKIFSIKSLRHQSNRKFDYWHHMV